jgi:hypothetical protein
VNEAKLFVRPFIAFGLILSLAAALSSVDYSWTNWRPASCLPANCFCEAIHRGAVAQPANTWSSFGFVLIGLLLMRQSGEDIRRRKPNLMASQRAYPLLFGIALIIIGLGSAFYHASLTFAGQFFDVMGMYLLASFIVLYNHSRLAPLSGRSFVSAYLLLNFILAVILIQYPAFRRYIFGLMIFATLIPEYRLRQQKLVIINSRYLRAAWGYLMLAFIIWALDLAKIFCDPDSWLQGHALWHLLCAVAAGFLYLYYRSENDGTARMGAPTR